MLTSPYLRNVQNTNDPNAYTQMADTFGSTRYNGNTDIYIRSGVFSHWFYVLVNGESGTNDIGNSYSVDGIGIDLAEELIVEAVFNNYLDGTTTYAAIRTAFITAAETIFCENSQEVKSVTDAWHAVGVGNAYSGNFINISGPPLICASGASYTVNNLPAGTTISWSSSSYITRNSAQGANPCTFSSSSSANGWIQATITLPGTCANNIVIRESVRLGTSPVDNVTFTNGAGGGGYLCTSHSGNMYQIYPNSPNTTYQYRLRRYPNLNVVYTSPTGQFNIGTINYIPPQGFYDFQVRTTNSCGTGPWIGHEVEYIDCSQGGWEGEFFFSVFPNPTSSTINIAAIAPERTSLSNNVLLEAFDVVENAHEITLKLFDISGQPVRTEKVMSTDLEKKMDVSHLKQGIYFLKIVGVNEDETHRIIIE